MPASEELARSKGKSAVVKMRLSTTAYEAKRPRTVPRLGPLPRAPSRGTPALAPRSRARRAGRGMHCHRRRRTPGDAPSARPRRRAAAGRPPKT